MNALEMLIDSLRQTLPHCTELSLTVVRGTKEWEEVVRKYDELMGVDAQKDGPTVVSYGTCNCKHDLLEPGGPCAAQVGADAFVERSILLAGLMELEGPPYTSPAGVLRCREIRDAARRAGVAAALSQGRAMPNGGSA